MAHELDKTINKKLIEHSITFHKASAGHGYDKRFHMHVSI